MRNKISEGEKRILADRYQQGESVQSICDEKGISKSALYNWIREFTPVVSGKTASYTLKEIEQLKRRNAKLEMIVEILKAVDCTASAPLQDRLAALESLHGQYDVYTLCEALDVARGTFYNFILRNKRNNAWFEKRREDYRILIRDIYNEYNQVFGARKICAILQQRGHKASDKYVATLMQEMGLYSVRTAAKQEHIKRNKPAKKENILKRNFSAEQPNQVWASDISCFKVNNQYYYLCVIIDLFSRKIIAHRISKKNSTQLATSVFRIACAERRLESGLVFHSDRGTQYTSTAFKKLLASHSVKHSFSHSGRPYDNAVAESFFATLKKEEFYRKDYRSDASFRKGIDAYIQFYNTERPHRTIKYMSPTQFEESFAAEEVQAVQ